MNDEVNRLIEAQNSLLKASGYRLSIRRIGDSLYLRATLPPRPDSPKKKRHQQTIALGLKAVPMMLPHAIAAAHRLGIQLAQREFDWAEWLEQKPKEILGAKAIAQFEKWKRPQLAASTWSHGYGPILSKIPPDEPLCPRQIRGLIESKPFDSRSRKQWHTVLSGLLKFHRIDHDFSDLWGTYNRPTNPRNVPSDAAITQMRDAIENGGHQLAFGLMAAYGLRNHELNCIESFDDDGAITIAGGKSGDRHIRKVWPLYPDWFQEWGLGELDKLPDWSGPHNAAVGARLTQVFARSPVISCTPYDLRHAWALRAIEYGLPVELAAIQMGHSLEVHTETYQFWLDSDRQRRVAERLRERSDRPRPPKVA